VNLHYDRSSTALSGEVPVAPAGSVVRTKEEPPPSDEGPPARSTWGTDKPVPQTPLK
jgi:hypothetical protein